MKGAKSRCFQQFDAAGVDGGEGLGSFWFADIQLVSDQLAADVPFRQEFGRREGAGCAYRHVSLADELGPGIAVLRDYVASGLTALCAGSKILLFVGGALDEGDLDGVDVHCCISAYAENVGVNGRCHILEIAAEELRHFMSHFFDYDRVKGVALESGATEGLLRDLPLLDAVPSTRSSPMTRLPSPVALAATLRHGALFFEELDNGTRLRLVTADVSALDRRVSIDEAFPPLDGQGPVEAE